jgi:hypothetical protein
VARQPNDTVQVNLRIKETERRRLEAAAEHNQVSLNAEMAARLARTFEQQHLVTLDHVADSVSRALQPLLFEVHELAKAGDLIRATDELVDLVQPLVAARVVDGGTGEQLRRAIDKIQRAKAVIGVELVRRLSKKLR